MSSDDIRQRRIQRLAALQSTANTGAANTGAVNTGTPISNAAAPPTSSQQAQVQKQPVQTQPQQQKEKLAQNSQAKAPEKQASNAVPTVQGENSGQQHRPKAPSTGTQPTENNRSSIPSVSVVLDLKQAETAGEWQEIEAEDVTAILFEQITSGNRKPLGYLAACYNRAAALDGHIPNVASMLKEQLITLAFISASAAEDDEVYENCIESFVEASFNHKLDPKFVHSLLQMGEEDESFLNTVIANCSTAIQNLAFGDPKTSSVFQVIELMLNEDSFTKQALQISRNPTPSPTYLSATFLGKIMNKGIAPLGLQDLHNRQQILVSEMPELIEMARESSPVSDLLESLQFSVIKKLVKKGPETRRLVLNWLGAVLDANHGQIATMRNPQHVNTLQLMLNCFKVLLRLAEPFVRLDAQSLMQQQMKINPDYFANTLSYNVSEETKVMAAQNAPFNEKKLETQLNFVTECFFLTVGFLQFGYHAAIEAINGSLKRHLEHIEAQLRGFDADPQVQNMSPAMRQLATGRFKGALLVLKSEVSGLTALLQHSIFLEQTMQFSEFTLAFVVNSAQNRLGLGAAEARLSKNAIKSSSGLEIDIPWEEDPPENYSSFPEFMVEAPSAAASFVLHTAEFIRNPSMAGGNELLFDSAMFFMSSPKVIRNPYLRGKFVELLFFGGTDIPLQTGSTVPGPLSSLFTSSETCRKHLLHALMSVFIDIEHTGRTSQFYEKFTTREFVANILKVLWRDPHYRNQLVIESEEKPSFFVKFVALLLNDATYLLDEAFGKLLEVYKLQKDPDSVIASGSSQTNDTRNRSGREADTEGDTGNGRATGNEEANDEEAEEQSDPEALLQSAERNAKSFLDLSKSNVALLNMFTSTVPSLFATPEIMDRFALMLNYNLAALVGPRCRELKVRNPDTLGFYPRQLLTDIVRVYLNLRSQSPFPRAIAKDERSYKGENFSKALSILQKYNLLSPIDLENFSELASQTKLALAEAKEEDEEFGDDIPDEFLDPLMYTLMENPVTLPTSKVNIDLSTIKTHLLSDPTDPFNRVPLSIDGVIPNAELKEKIAEFKRQKKAERQENKMID